MRDPIPEIQERFEAGLARHANNECRIGAELKFPLVCTDGKAVPESTVQSLWRYLEDQGWTLEMESGSSRAIGARRPGPQNDTVASCETGYCKTEFSLAHVGDLFELESAVLDLRDLLRPFAQQHNAAFIGYGILPVTPPSKSLLMKKNRSSVWDKVFPSNSVIAPEDGDDVHLFTVNAGSHVHVSLPPDAVLRAVNILNGFSGPQLTLTADSSIWKANLDPDYLCVSEKLWDWWSPAQDRSGVPPAPFKDIRHYLETIVQYKPVYIMRDGAPVTLKKYNTFLDYYSSDEASGESADGQEIKVTPSHKDLELHNSCYWFNARVSRYYTVENRVMDQQPPDDLLVPAALTLGLTSALDEAEEALNGFAWNTLRQMRDTACRRSPSPNGMLIGLARTMLDVADTGLQKRGLGESCFLEPLYSRLKQKTCPARQADDVFTTGGATALVANRQI